MKNWRKMIIDSPLGKEGIDSAGKNSNCQFYRCKGVWADDKVQVRFEDLKN